MLSAHFPLPICRSETTNQHVRVKRVSRQPLGASSLYPPRTCFKDFLLTKKTLQYVRSAFVIFRPCYSIETPSSRDSPARVKLWAEAASYDLDEQFRKQSRITCERQSHHRPHMADRKETRPAARAVQVCGTGRHSMPCCCQWQLCCPIQRRPMVVMIEKTNVAVWSAPKNEDRRRRVCRYLRYIDRFCSCGELSLPKFETI